jgi:hypothetical protein
VGQVTDMGANAPEMCRIVSSQYVLDITAGAGDWENTQAIPRFLHKETSACPDAQKSGAIKAEVANTDKTIEAATYCKVDGINYIVEVIGMDGAGNSVPLSEHHDTAPLMIKLLERTRRS